MAITNLTMRSLKPAAAGGSDRQLPHVVTVSGSVSDLRSKGYVIYRFSGYAARVLAFSGEPGDLMRVFLRGCV